VLIIRPMPISLARGELAHGGVDESTFGTTGNEHDFVFNGEAVDALDGHLYKEFEVRTDW
jgi:hypothetical protein